MRCLLGFLVMRLTFLCPRLLGHYLSRLDLWLNHGGPIASVPRPSFGRTVPQSKTSPRVDPIRGAFSCVRATARRRWVAGHHAASCFPCLAPFAPPSSLDHLTPRTVVCRLRSPRSSVFP